MENLIISQKIGRVGVIKLNRPDQLNALNRSVMEEIGVQARNYDQDREIGCIVITGNGKAFAAGADIDEMHKAGKEVVNNKWFNKPWTDLPEIDTPIIAAVNGFALGGGCEVAMMCDMIIASEKAKFGQPEVKLGVIPGMGGSQRLARFIGKPMAMDLCLTGRFIDANEAKAIGLVSRVLSYENFEQEYMAIANEVASMSLITAITVTKAIDAAYEIPLQDALENERNCFYSCFDNKDQDEGMSAFLQKRAPNWNHE